MARSSKKKNNKIDYLVYDEACRKFKNETLIGIANRYGGSIDTMAKRMKDKFVGDVLVEIPNFHLEDDKYLVTSILVKLAYNNKLHCGVYAVVTDALNKKTEVEESKIFYRYTYANQAPEVVAEFVGNLCDDIAEKCWQVYQQVVDKD